MPVSSRSRHALAADDEGGMAADSTFGVGSLVTVVPRSDGGGISGRNDGGVGTVVDLDEAAATATVEYALGGRERGVAVARLRPGVDMGACIGWEVDFRAKASAAVCTFRFSLALLRTWRSDSARSLSQCVSFTGRREA